MRIWQKLKHKFGQLKPRTLLIYLILYFLAGLSMNLLGQQLEIARFNHWWQVVSSYLIYMVPVSVLLRGMAFHAQYAYGLVAMGLLEFTGYALETSYVYPDNILVEWFGPYTFALGMALFFALYIPLGNWAVAGIDRAIAVKRFNESD